VIWRATPRPKAAERDSRVAGELSHFADLWVICLPRPPVTPANQAKADTPEVSAFALHDRVEIKDATYPLNFPPLWIVLTRVSPLTIRPVRHKPSSTLPAHLQKSVGLPQPVDITNCF
jgi:hypothetical protein